MGFFAGLISMLGWGIADFFAAKSSRSIGALRTLFFAQLIGLFIISSYFIFAEKLPEIGLREIIITLLLSLIYVVSFVFFYKSLEMGPVSIVSPVAASYGMVAVILSVLFLNEVLSQREIGGIILVILGIILASTNLKEVFSGKIKLSKGIIFAFFVMIGWGIFYTFLTVLVDKWGWFFAAFSVRVFLLLFLAFYLLFFKQPFLFKPKTNIAFLILGIGIFEAIATLSYNIGIERELTAIIAPISATFPLITIILAGIFLKERLILNQYLGIVFVIAGLVFLAL